jgi:hypothetical protein
MVKAAAMVLREAHTPLHVTGIVQRMIQGGFPTKDARALRLSLTGTLDRGSKEESGWFRKVSPATYTLRDTATEGVGALNGAGTEHAETSK